MNARLFVCASSGNMSGTKNIIDVRCGMSADTVTNNTLKVLKHQNHKQNEEGCY